MKALLLAAGLGTRLQPLTNMIPKCLVPIKGRPLLDYWLQLLLDNGIDHVVLNTHHMSSTVHDYLSNSTWKSNITLVYEEELLGTGGTILANRRYFEDEPFLVAHADNLTIFELRSFANRHARRPTGTEITMMLFETDSPTTCGIVTLDSNNVVSAFHEKISNPPGNLANAAIYIFEPAILDFLAKLNKKNIDLSTEVIPSYIGRAYTYLNACYHRDIGSLASWRTANDDFPPFKNVFRNSQAWEGTLSKEIQLQVQNLLVQDTQTGPSCGQEN